MNKKKKSVAPAAQLEVQTSDGSGKKQDDGAEKKKQQKKQRRPQSKQSRSSRLSAASRSRWEAQSASVWSLAPTAKPSSGDELSVAMSMDAPIVLNPLHPSSSVNGCLRLHQRSAALAVSRRHIPWSQRPGDRCISFLFGANILPHTIDGDQHEKEQVIHTKLTKRSLRAASSTRLW